MTIKQLRETTQMTQKAFAEYFGIPKRSVENWEGGQRECPQYLLDLMKYKLKNEGFNPPYIVEIRGIEQNVTSFHPAPPEVNFRILPKICLSK